tara:strand:- start:8 stop:184 length:177 start_codon:yes stop_codon:yes gene_type:complete
MKYIIEHEYTERRVDQYEVEADTHEQALAIVQDEHGKYTIMDSHAQENTSLSYTVRQA